MLSTTILKTENDVLALADGWRALHKSMGQIPFTDFDWALDWWRTIGKPSAAQLAVIVCHEDGKLVGVLPFIVRRHRGVRVLHLFGHEIFYYRAFLIAHEQAGQALWRAALSSDLCDIAYIKNIHDDTPARAFIERAAWRLEEKPIYHVALTATTRAQVLASLPKGLKRKATKAAKILAAEPSLAVHKAEGQAQAEIIDYLSRRKTVWAQERGKRGFYSDPNAPAFSRDMARRGAQENSLVQFWLTRDGLPVAALTCYAFGQTLYSHTHGYDLEVSSYSPGHILHVESLVWAAEKDCREVNFMEGDEHYKQHYANGQRLAREYVFAATLAGHLHLWLYCCVRLVRALKARLVCAALGRKCHARMPVD